MARRRRRPLVLSRPAQVRAASSPTAHRLLGALERLGPASVRELAEQVGMAPASLYYHVRRLVEVGVVRAAGERATDRRPETLYELAGGGEVELRGGGSRRVAEEVARAGRGMLRLAARLYAEAAGERQPDRPRGRRRNVLVQAQGRLSPAALAEVNRRLEDLAAYVAEQDDPERDGMSCLTLALSPVRRAR